MLIANPFNVFLIFCGLGMLYLIGYLFLPVFRNWQDRINEWVDKRERSRKGE